MSDVYYATRLRYTSLVGGVAKLHGCSVPLSMPPDLLPGVDVAEIDYAPEVQSCRLRPLHCGWRDMTAEEIAAADVFLQRAVANAEGAPT